MLCCTVITMTAIARVSTPTLLLHTGQALIYYVLWHIHSVAALLVSQRNVTSSLVTRSRYTAYRTRNPHKGRHGILSLHRVHCLLLLLVLPSFNDRLVPHHQTALGQPSPSALNCYANHIYLIVMVWCYR